MNKYLVKIAAKFEDQIYPDHSGEYKVPSIFDWAKSNTKLREFKVKDLEALAFEHSSEEDYDEVPGSKPFVSRAMKTDLNHPIVVVQYKDGNFIADGTHRLWKARAAGHRKIKGYLIREEDLKHV